MTDEQRREILFTAQAERIATLTAEIKARQDELDAIKRQILENHEPGTYQAGNLTVQVRAGRRTLNQNRFREKYPIGDYPEYYEIKPLPLSHLEKELGRMGVEDCISTSRPTVSVS
ncbi:hypothetical protein [Bifidobacterium tissieri]|uniref:hypothetical protein n=1 Tax=Bifidobacterium tissieri TaxID=1630162 RepID=UPI001CC30D2B|nr:hypothetical protein [Bifidobacterium tissieri]